MTDNVKIWSFMNDEDDDCDDGKYYGGNYVTVEQDNEVEIGEAKKLHSLGTAT